MDAEITESLVLLAYSGHDFEREAGRRNNEKWLKTQQISADACVLPVWRDNNLIDDRNETAPRAAFLQGGAALSLLRERASIFLGRDGQHPIFACDLSDLDLEEARAAVADKEGDDMSFVDLRRVGALLPHGEGALLAYARGMVYWHNRHRFCGVCGKPTQSEDAGHVRRCSDSACETAHFPRTDPAVIMLVTHDGPEGERCLLGRQPSWQPGQFSSLAGFVEPGESLESAVAREVYEEARIHVTDVTYRESQPWPFPSSLMLGFRARALDTEIDTSEDELEEARWFTRDELIEHYRRQESIGVLSSSDSIARKLINDWLAGQ